MLARHFKLSPMSNMASFFLKWNLIILLSDLFFFSSETLAFSLVILFKWNVSFFSLRYKRRPLRPFLHVVLYWFILGYSKERSCLLNNTYNTIQFAALLYRWNYLKMIFDPKLWQQEAVGLLASTVASLYATILCCVYIAFAFTELVTYPLFKVRHTLVLLV